MGAHCAINCPGRCSAWKFHVKDDEVVWVDTCIRASTGSATSMTRSPVRACAVVPYRRWMNHPDRINYPMKRAEGAKRGEGKFERISWDEALDTGGQRSSKTSFARRTATRPCTCRTRPA